MRSTTRDLQTVFEVGILGDRSDGELLGRFVEWHEQAVFEAIVRRHAAMVWGVCRRILQDDHDADDAFQATFIVLARRAASVVPPEKLGNWLYGVAYQTARNSRAIRAKRRLREGRLSDISEPEVSPQDVRDDLTELLDRELSRLPEKYRIPVVLCDLEGMSHKEAARQLGWPIGTVSSRQSRARAMLAKRLARRGLSLSVGSLAVLLVQKSASAIMPTRLIGSTGRAASLFAAGGGASARVVSVGIAVVLGEVSKVMLLGKLKIATAVFLTVSALAVGGTGLAYWATVTEPDQKDSVQRQSDDKEEHHGRTHKRKGDDQPKDRQKGIAGDDEPEKRRDPVELGFDAGFKGAFRLIRLGRFSEAERQFAWIAKVHRQTTWGERSQFYLAESQYQQKKYVAAHDSYETLHVDYPATQYKDKLTRREYEIAQIWLAQVDPKEPAEKRLPWSATLSGQVPFIDFGGSALRVLQHVRNIDPDGPFAEAAAIQIADY
jgi:RNA polymerase sigma-70 factor (ECF subfamily)